MSFPGIYGTLTKFDHLPQETSWTNFKESSCKPQFPNHNAIKLENKQKIGEIHKCLDTKQDTSKEHLGQTQNHEGI